MLYLHKFIKKIDFGPPPPRPSFFVPLLRFLNENDNFGVLAISHQKSISLVPANAKSIFPEHVKFPEATSLEPVQPRNTFRPLFGGQNVTEKCSAAAQARAKLFLQMRHFFAKSILHWQGRAGSTFGVKSRATENRNFHSKV